MKYSYFNNEKITLLSLPLGVNELFPLVRTTALQDDARISWGWCEKIIHCLDQYSKSSVLEYDSIVQHSRSTAIQLKMMLHNIAWYALALQPQGEMLNNQEAVNLSEVVNCLDTWEIKPRETDTWVKERNEYLNLKYAKALALCCLEKIPQEYPLREMLHDITSTLFLRANLHSVFPVLLAQVRLIVQSRIDYLAEQNS